MSHIRQQSQFVLTPQSSSADIVVATLQNPDTATVVSLRESAATRFLLVVEGTWYSDLQVALDAGVRAVLFRTDFTWARFDEALRQVRVGHGDLPTALQGQLMDQVQRTYREVLSPRGLTPSGLTAREVHVLRLVAEGDELQEIGTKLGYSARTIKSVLYGVIKRNGLRNRAHAVAYAIRRGLI
ncbi:LuxR C-terminal-related transcriptional regulator [Streptomyces sp. NPDC005708]|uniref:response regulator transcription factor n=1 Tax=Streptomyces sp. NPDC005708 TaxID=3154564 RepID=UPI0034025751